MIYLVDTYRRYMGRFECHSHSHYSNLRLLDCINTPSKLVKYAQEIGLKGICITDHEALGGHVELDKIQQELIEQMLFSFHKINFYDEFDGFLL